MQFSYWVSEILIRCVAYFLNVETNGAVFPTLIIIVNISILRSTHLPSEMQERSVLKCQIVMAYGSHWTGFKFTDLHNQQINNRYLIVYLYSILHRHLCIWCFMFACLFLYKRFLILNTKTCSLTSHNHVRDSTKCLSENRVTMTPRITPDLSTNRPQIGRVWKGFSGIQLFCLIQPDKWQGLYLRSRQLFDYCLLSWHWVAGLRLHQTKTFFGCQRNSNRIVFLRFLGLYE